jgi:ribonucleotide monophosphatase NagD (HAD superfamily)
VTQRIDTLAAVSSNFDAIVFGQWGVLHDGSAPYSGTIDCLASLANTGQYFGGPIEILAVLSNSGKRSAPNAARIHDMGFAQSMFAQMMTSGEALWRDIHEKKVSHTRFFAIERSVGDAAAWVDEIPIKLTNLKMQWLSC